MNAKVLEILALCLEAKEKGHDVFFLYSPHTNGLEIRSFENGWEKKPEGEINDPTKYIQFYLDREDSNDRIRVAWDYLKELV